MAEALVYFAQKAFIISQGDLLIVQRSSDDPNNAGYWEVPGGRIEPGETLEDHIRREVKEETGVEVTPGEPFHIWQWNIKRSQSSLSPATIIAVARVCTATSRSLSDKGRVAEDHLGEMKWVPLSSLDSINWIPNMKEVVSAFVKLTIDRGLVKCDN